MLFALTVLLALLVASLVISLRTPAVRQTILDRVSQSVESSTGARLEARDFSLSPGVLIILDLELSDPEADTPFLSVPRIEAAFDLGSLLRARKHVRWIRIDSPRINLAAPMPDFASNTTSTEPADPLAIDIAEITVRDGSLVGPTLSPDIEMWLDRFRAVGLNVDGSLLDDQIRLVIDGSRLVAESSRRPAIEVALRSQLQGSLQGPFELERLRLEGDGLDLAARGKLETTSTGPHELTFELDANLAQLFPDLATSGHLGAEGEIRLASNTLDGTTRLDVRGLPGELLRPLLGTGSLAAFDPDGTALDANADLQASTTWADPNAADHLTGKATLSWKRDDRVLVKADFRTLDDAKPHFGFDALALPDEKGKRRLAGTFQASSWDLLIEGALADTRLTLDLPNLEAAATQLGLESLLGEWRPAGVLQAVARVDGPILSPRLDLEAKLESDRGPLIEVAAHTAQQLDLDRSTAALPIDLIVDLELLSTASGRRTFEGRLKTPNARAVAEGDLRPITLEEGRIDLQLPDVAATLTDLTDRWRQLFPHAAPPESLSKIHDLSRRARGALDVEARAEGPLSDLTIELDGGWRVPLDESSQEQTIQLNARGLATAEAPYFDGAVNLRVESLDVARFAPTLEETGPAGQLDVTLDFLGTPSDHTAKLRVEGENLVWGDGPGISPLLLEATSDGTTLTLEELSGRFDNGQPFEGFGSFEPATTMPPLALPWPIDSGQLRLCLPAPLADVDNIELLLDVKGSELQARIELQGAEPIARTAAALRVALTPSQRRLWLVLTGLELDPFLPLVGLGADDYRPRASLDGVLTIDLDDPTAATGFIEVSRLAVATTDQELEVGKDIRLMVGERRLELLPTDFLGGLDASGILFFEETWQIGNSPAELVKDLKLQLGGRFDASQLKPLLPGIAASGDLAVVLDAEGTLEAPSVTGRINGNGAELFVASPYPTRLRNPVLRFSTERGGTRLDSFKALLNGGPITASGSIDEARGLRLETNFRDVLYRVDFGLTTRVRGRLALRQPPRGRGLLTGDIVVDRGTLRRDIEIDRELLALLFAPSLTSTADASQLDSIDLDLTVTSNEGVRVKNNLGDLRADWSRLRIRGTAQNPLIEGKIEIDPGGVITAYSQTVRVDEASATFSGDPAVGPRLEIATTSSLDDPSLSTRRRGLPQTSLGDSGPGAGGFWDTRTGANVNASDELTTGLMTHYTDRIAGTLSSSFAHTRLSLEPLPIFGETSTEARLTATQRLSEEADLIYSVNPRDAEGQTYILDVHNVSFAPGFAAQVFTNDENNEGGTLVHVLELGGSPRQEASSTRLDSVSLRAPEALSKRRLERAIGFEKGDPFPEDGAFDVEVDVLEEVHRQGFPDGRVEVSSTPAGDRTVLGVTVEPGLQVRYEFTGDAPPRAARPSITQLYRSSDVETAFEEMRSRTIKALREEGFLAPKVEISQTVDANERVVIIRGEGGRRVAPGTPIFEGLAAEEAELLAAQFTSRLSRIELAVALPGADRYLLQSLKAMGFPDAQIGSRRLSDDGHRLEIELVAGARQHIRKIDVTGLDNEDAARLRERLPARIDAPARSDLITRSAHYLEDELRHRGHADVDIKTRLEPIAEDRPYDLVLHFAVEAGPIHRVAGVSFEGLKGTRQKFAEKVAGLEPGGVFRAEDVSNARRQLSRTGLFESIRTSSEPEPDGAAGEETRVVFDLAERPRYLVAYGARWESGEGFGVVADAIDQNFLGRGRTLGLRAIYSGDDDRSLRLYHSVPRALTPRGTLEVFLEGKSETFDTIEANSVEGWAQLTTPLGRRTQNRVYLRYQDLSLHFSEDDASDRRFVIPSVGWQLSFDSRESVFDGRIAEGFFFGLDVVGALEELGSDVSLFGLFSQLKYFQNLAKIGDGRKTSGNLTWAQSLRLGLLDAFDDTRVPLVNQLRAGGEYSVRGYRTDSLGPLDLEGDLASGEALFILNQELHFPVWGEDLSGLVFFDAGNIWETRDAIDSELFTSVGFGLRARTVVGPLRLDVAFPLDRREDDDSYKIYIGFGNIF